MFPRRSRNEPEDARRHMVQETSAFLTWALRTQADVPRIPCRRIDRGGFSELLKRRGARAAVAHWWVRALDRSGM
ncbi:MAG: hypothetical protein WD009_14685 [Phycisphaeraceae bacterium]